MKWPILKLFGQMSVISYVLTLSIFALFIIREKKPQAQKTLINSTIQTPTASLLESSKTENVTKNENIKKDLFSELGLHNTLNDCWVTYEGHIYDITSFFGSHPGGDAYLLQYCGRDMGVGFDTKNKNPASLHSQEARNMLNQYQIQ